MLCAVIVDWMQLVKSGHCGCNATLLLTECSGWRVDAAVAMLLYCWLNAAGEEWTLRLQCYFIVDWMQRVRSGRCGCNATLLLTECSGWRVDTAVAMLLYCWLNAAGEEWRKMTTMSKAPYEQRAEEERRKYEQAMKDYNLVSWFTTFCRCCHEHLVDGEMYWLTVALWKSRDDRVVWL